MNETIPNSLLCDSNYLCIRRDRIGRIGGGVCFFIHRSVKFSEVTFDDQRFSSLEALAVDLYFKNGPYRVCCVYRPPDASVDFPKNLCEWILLNCGKISPTVLVGDFNLPMFNWEDYSLVPKNETYSSFLDCVLQCDLKQFVHEPTFGNNILDLLLCTDENCVMDVKIENGFSTSAHAIVSFQLPAFRYKDSHAHTFFDFKNGDYANFEVYLGSVDWAGIFSACNTVQEFWDSFSNVVKDGIETFVPQKKCRVKRKFNNSRLQKLCLRKRRLYRVWKRTKLACDKMKYKRCADEHRREAINLSTENEIRILNDGNLKGFYNFVNSKLRGRDTVPVLKNEGCLVVSDRDKAELFNKFFGSVFCDDNGVIPASVNRVRENTRMSVINFDVEAIRTVLKSLPGKLSATPDGFPSFLFKKLSSVLATPLASIFEVSFRTNCLPSVWLTAVVCPIYKKGSASNVQNYRPISLTCVACKVMEKIIKFHLLKFLSTNKLITSHQHGFLSRRSTCTQLLETKNDWERFLEDNKVVDVAYLDFRKAFDVVCHSKLFAKLKTYGIDGFLLNWIQAFLSGRTQRVKINGSFSDPCLVQSGVPQGSVLGPILFLLYVNDVVECVPDGFGLKIFADDLKIYVAFSPKSWCLPLSPLCEALGRISSWAAKWQLELSVEKCLVLHLGRKGANPGLPCVMNGTPLKVENCARDLGVQMAFDLKSHSHVVAVVKKAFSRAHLIFRCFSVKDMSVLLRAYKVYVRPLLECDTPVWNPHLKQDIDLVEHVQRFYTRRMFQICNVPYKSYDERLIQCKIDPLEFRRKVNDLCMTYNIVHGFVDIPLNAFFVPCPEISRNLTWSF